ELGPGLGVGVLVAPGSRGGDQVGHAAQGAVAPAHSAATIFASNALMTASAALPASMTSSWLSGVFWMPAARFVMSDIPRISMPACRAAIASSAVDIPTM